jgi:glutathione S-transferase
MGAMAPSSPTSLELKYFNIEGKGAPIRMLVRHVGFERFVDTRLKDGEFPALKASGALAFGQVPCLEVTLSDGTKTHLFQTASILRYIGKVCGGDVYPTDALQAAFVDAVMDQEADLFLGVSASKYAARMGFGCLDDATIAKVRKSLNDEVLPRHLGFFEELLKRSTTGWLCNTANPSCADFLLAPRLKWLASGAVDGISTTILSQFPLVEGFVEKFYAVPAVAAYVKEQASS